MAPGADRPLPERRRARRRAAAVPHRPARRRAPLHRDASASAGSCARHRAAVTISVLATTGFAVGGTIAMQRIVAARDEAAREAAIAQIRKQRRRAADRLHADPRTERSCARSAGSTCSRGLGTEVRHYYDTLAKVPGGMPAEDEIRMVEAIDLIGEAEHTVGQARQGARDVDGSRATASSASSATTPARRARSAMRRLRAQLDIEIGAVMQQQRGSSPTRSLSSRRPSRSGTTLERRAAEGALAHARRRRRARQARRRAARRGQDRRGVRASTPRRKTERERATSHRQRPGHRREDGARDEPPQARLRSISCAANRRSRSTSTGGAPAARAICSRASPTTSSSSRRCSTSRTRSPTSSSAARRRRRRDRDLPRSAAADRRARAPRPDERRLAAPARRAARRPRIRATRRAATSRTALDQLDQAIELQKDLAARDPKSTRYRSTCRARTRAPATRYVGLGARPTTASRVQARARHPPGARRQGSEERAVPPLVRVVVREARQRVRVKATSRARSRRTSRRSRCASSSSPSRRPRASSRTSSRPPRSSSGACCSRARTSSAPAS